MAQTPETVAAVRRSRLRTTCFDSGASSAAALLVVRDSTVTAQKVLVY